MFLIPDDVPYWLPSLKILVRDQLNIPGLHTIGYYNYLSASHRLHNHYHKMMEITVILKGTQQFYVDDTLHTLQGGDMFVTRPYEGHGNNGNFQDICEYVWFQFDLSDPDIDFLGLGGPQGSYLYQQVCSYPHRIKAAHQSDLALLKKAFFLLADATPQKRMLGQSYLLSFVINNLCASDDLPQTRTALSEIQIALSFIHEHLYEDIDIETIAAHVGLSASRFKTRFKNECGTTPYAYITTRRIEVAKTLLKDPGYTITEVAHLLNYSSSNHFSTVFKKHTGMTPSQYQAMHIGQKAGENPQ